MTKQLSKSKRARVFQMYGERCAYCGDEITAGTFHVDHVVPKWDGGGSAIDNLMPSCPACNLSKRSRSLDYLRMRMSCPAEVRELGFSFNQLRWLKARGVLSQMGIDEGFKFFFEVVRERESA